MPTVSRDPPIAAAVPEKISHGSHNTVVTPRLQMIQSNAMQM